MNTYKYVVKDENGKTLKGKVEARDEKQAVIFLRNRRLVIISLQITNQSSGPSAFRARVSRDDVVQFTQQLSTMLNSGLPLTDALELLKAQTKPAMVKVLSSVQGDVQGGMNLADALNRHPEVFSSVYVALVRAGEASGKIDTILTRLAENEEKQREFRAKVKGAMIYPAIITVAMIAVMIVIMVFVVPQLQEMYASFEATLPIQTTILIGISNMVRNYWYIVGAVVGAAVFGLKQWQKTPMGAKQIDQLYFKIPVFGELRRLVIMAEFSRTLSLLVAAGISILEGLAIVSQTVGNTIYRESIQFIAKGVEKGMPLATMIARERLFPPLMSQMMAVGEETGKLDEVMGKVAEYFEQNAEHKVKNLTTAIEPIIMIVLGVMVAFIVFSVITPLYKITEMF